MIAEKIIAIARSYVGQKEKPGNSGFVDAAFENKMRGVGWYPGASWCAFFGMLVWLEAYASRPDIQKLIRKYANGSTRQTYFNFRASKEFKVRDYPVRGALVIFQHGSGTTGHEGVVSWNGTDSYLSIEGNTNAGGGREGIEVAEQTRKLRAAFSAKGLNILGFVHPIEI